MKRKKTKQQRKADRAAKGHTSGIKGNYVYVMSLTKGEGPCKIGMSRNLTQRRKAMQTYNWQKVKLHYKMECSSSSRMKRLEALVHMELSEHRLRGEWFNLDAKKCEEAIKSVARKYRDMTLDEMDSVLNGEAVSVSDGQTNFRDAA